MSTNPWLAYNRQGPFGEVSWTSSAATAEVLEINEDAQTAKLRILGGATMELEDIPVGGPSGSTSLPAKGDVVSVNISGPNGSTTTIGSVLGSGGDAPTTGDVNNFRGKRPKIKVGDADMSSTSGSGMRASKGGGVSLTSASFGRFMVDDEGNAKLFAKGLEIRTPGGRIVDVIDESLEATKNTPAGIEIVGNEIAGDKDGIAKMTLGGLLHGNSPGFSVATRKPGSGKDPFPKVGITETDPLKLAPQLIKLLTSVTGLSALSALGISVDLSALLAAIVSAGPIILFTPKDIMLNGANITITGTLTLGNMAMQALSAQSATATGPITCAKLTTAGKGFNAAANADLKMLAGLFNNHTHGQDGSVSQKISEANIIGLPNVIG